MKAIATTHSRLFFSAATSAGPLTSTWGQPFRAKTRANETADARAARRRLPRFEPESAEWPEVAVRAVLAVTILGAYVTAIWQIGGF